MYGCLELVFLNCYRHWSLFVFRNGDGTGSVLHSREGVTQGGPLEMIAYEIGILPPINNFKQDVPDVPQP